MRIVGSRILKLSQFEPVQDRQLLNRLDPAVRSNVVAVSLTALGIQHGGPYPQVFNDGGGLFELFANGKRLPLSRWPKTGWSTMKRVAVNGDAKTPGTFEYPGDRPSRWIGNSDIWLKGQWRVQWEDPAIRVAKIDPDSRTITFAAGVALGIGNKYKRPQGSGEEPWCAINLPEEITAPGEWAVDFTTQTLLLYPPDNTRELMISQLDKPFITARGVTNLKLIGLTFDCSLGDGIEMDDVDST